jgi:tRNA(Ile)-lysidine synthase
MVDALTASFQDFVRQEKLFHKEDKLLLACSGGLDSTVLAHLLHAEGYDFAIAHMNFQLREEAADEDAAFVADLAQTLDAKFFGKAVNTKTLAESGESTQMTARRLRYKYLEEILDEYNYHRLLIAHHAEDNLETVLINLIRGTGIHGIAGMRPTAGRTCRPLLNTPRRQLESYAADHSITWREDGSNTSDDYLRNRVRHHLTPVLYDDFGLTPENWAKTAGYLRSAASVYDHHMSHLRATHCESRDSLWIVNRGNWVRGELRTFLHEQVHVYGFTDEQLRQMLELPGQRSLESERAVVYVTPERLVFELKSGIDKRQPNPKKISELPAANVQAGYYRMSLALIPRPEVLDEVGVQYLASPPLPLHLRPRQKGDRFTPLGMSGKSKKVKEYMIDEKIPVWLRDRIYLLTDANDDIVAIPGHCISERFKVRPEDEVVLRIALQ